MTAPDIRRISTIEQWDEFIAEAENRAIWLLKHSLACPLSRDGLQEFERFVSECREGSGDESRYAVIEIQNARELSHEIALRTGVRHESPQAFLIVGGEVRWHGSHWSITAAALSGAAQATGVTSGVGHG